MSQEYRGANLRDLDTGALVHQGIGDQLASKTLTGTGTTGDPANPGVGELILPVRPGDGTMLIRYTSIGASNTLQFEATLDGGTNWDGVNLSRLDGGNATAAASTNSGSTTWFGLIPPGATHVRVRVSAIGTAPLVRLATRQGSAHTALSANATLPAVLSASGSMVGYVKAAGVWQDDSSTPLAASGTFTGASRDLTNGNSANALWNGTTAAQVGSVEVRLGTASDVAGTLALEISRDNATWRRIREVPASNAGTGGLFVAELAYKPWTRWARMVYVNGAGAQGHFTAQSFLMSA